MSKRIGTWKLTPTLEQAQSPESVRQRHEGRRRSYHQVVCGLRVFHQIEHVIRTTATPEHWRRMTICTRQGSRWRRARRFPLRRLDSFENQRKYARRQNGKRLPFLPRCRKIKSPRRVQHLPPTRSATATIIPTNYFFPFVAVIVTVAAALFTVPSLTTSRAT